MTNDVPVLPEPTGEIPPEGTPVEKASPGEQPKPEAPKTEEPDWKAAFTGLQENLNKSHARTEAVLAQNALLADALASVKVEQRSSRSAQNELVKATLGEDKARELIARDAQLMAQEAARRAAEASTRLHNAQATLYLDALAAVGIDPQDPEIDWAQDSGLNVEQWAQRVGASVRAKIGRTLEQRSAKDREANAVRSKAEIKAEADALAQRIVKEQGVDKIDTAKGQTSANFLDRVRNADPSSPEFKRMVEDAKSGRLRI